jgi:hypothetical protein
VGKAVKPAATTPLSASLWKIAGTFRRVSVTRYRWIAFTLLAISSGNLCPSRPIPATWPMPCPSRLSSWLRIGPSTPRMANGTTQDSCIAFSSMLIWRSSSSARCIGVAEIVDVMADSFPAYARPKTS